MKGFRNFKDTKVNFNEKTLIIGANDIGKSNLIYALRILLDKKNYLKLIQNQKIQIFMFTKKQMKSSYN